jgi:hypothetical protein
MSLFEQRFNKKIEYAIYRKALSSVEKLVYNSTLEYFIFNPPNNLVKQNKKIDHEQIKQECFKLFHKQIHQDELAQFSKEPAQIIEIVYENMFGKNGILLDNYLFKEVGKGHFKRILPPSNNEMYRYIVKCATDESVKKWDFIIKI